MKVVTEAHHVRKKQILDTAEKFFFEKGYAKTTISDIINKIDIANGTFYHYFKSKDDLLMAIIDRDVDASYERISEIVNNDNLTALEKINTIYESSFTSRIQNSDRTKLLLEVFYHNEDNILFLHKRNLEFLKRITPLFSKMMDQGMEEGVFNFGSSRFTAELILRMGNQLDEAFAKFMLKNPHSQEDKDTLFETYEAYSLAVHRLLGVENGMLKIINRASVEIFFDDNK